MAVVRVFLCTYRRNELLRRAVASLLAQTFTDWVCELHNDDPGDPFPAKLVNDLGDPRISAVTHQSNLGPTRTFNLMYRGGVRERYVSLLEDDNWWGPDFLDRVTREMDCRPSVQVGWANMRLWEELPDGSWRDTGRCVWNETVSEEPILMGWPDRRQLRGAIHSNGAMLVRSDHLEELRVPDSTPFSAVEAVRERRFRFPILFVPTPLANFALTRTTSRGNDRTLWGQAQALLAASFFRHVHLAPEILRDVWEAARRSSPPTTNALISSGLLERRARYTLKYARVRDWVRFVASLVRRPLTTLRVLKAKTAMPEVWATLDASTCATHEQAGSPTCFAANQGAVV